MKFAVFIFTLLIYSVTLAREYPAKVLRVKDGDTYVLNVDLGFNISHEITLRLDGVDTPETWRPKSKGEKLHGLEATAFVKALIEGKKVIIHSIYSGAYSRSGGRVRTLDGIDLTKALIDNGYEKKAAYGD